MNGKLNVVLNFKKPRRYPGVFCGPKGQPCVNGRNPDVAFVDGLNTNIDGFQACRKKQLISPII